jgi:F1F0 ATPase subunit 2
MTQLNFILLAVFGGGLAGGIFFGGLWWTVQRIQQVRSPALLVLGSLLLRLVLTMAVFYAIMAVTGQLLYLGLALLAFLAVRLILTRQVKGSQHAIES